MPDDIIYKPLKYKHKMRDHGCVTGKNYRFRVIFMYYCVERTGGFWLGEGAPRARRFYRLSGQ